jgi:hypothetical protein
MKLQFSASNPSLIITDRFGLTSHGCWEAQGENFRSALCVERAHTVSQFMTSPGTKLKNNKSCPLTSSPDNNEQTRESANTHRTSLSHAAENTQTTTRPSTLVLENKADYPLGECILFF